MNVEQERTSPLNNRRDRVHFSSVSINNLPTGCSATSCMQMMQSYNSSLNKTAEILTADQDAHDSSLIFHIIVQNHTSHIYLFRLLTNSVCHRIKTDRHIFLFLFFLLLTNASVSLSLTCLTQLRPSVHTAVCLHENNIIR